jgi:hypothetical protein
LQALQVAWRGQESSDPNKYQQIDKLEEQMKVIQQRLPTSNVSTPMPLSDKVDIPLPIEPLPPQLDLPDNYEVTPMNY